MWQFFMCVGLRVTIIIRISRFYITASLSLIIYTLFFPVDFFERRDKVSEIYWPSQKVVEKIKRLGCHVVPKPSKKNLTSFQEGLIFLFLLIIFVF